MSGHADKRQVARIQPFVAPCRYVVGEQRVPGFLTDLSRCGGRIHSEVEPPAMLTPIVVEARLGRLATRLRLPAAVRWRKPAPRGGFLFGLSFDRLGADEQAILDEVVEEFHRRAALIE